ncbi:solute carrier family 22 member 21-like [Rhipicephalus sanguineus]|uniref:solute carrier family 22 member 21-like n=1 Tax=Rhipicephalus sanguineus TaxID=34632 RepID=UPI0018933393|nr:solute carrier family 22 member 21-like [Rhipicephalus sanguineus]
MQQQMAASPASDGADSTTGPSPSKRHKKRDNSGPRNLVTDTTRQEGAPQSPHRSRRHKKKKHHRIASLEPGELAPPLDTGGGAAEAEQALRRATGAEVRQITPGHDNVQAPVETGVLVSRTGSMVDATSVLYDREKEGDVLPSVTPPGVAQEKEAVVDTPRAPGKDNVVAIFGGNGAYQRLSLGFVMMAYFSLSVHLFIDAVIEREVHFTCKPLSWANVSIPEDDAWSTTRGWSKRDDDVACRQRQHPESGDVTIPCPAWLYENARRHNNIVPEWDMVCSRQWLRPFTRFAFLAGSLVAWVLPFLVDRTGRRPIILLAVVAASMFSFAIYFVKSVLLFMICRCLLGLFLIVLYIASFVLMFEAVSREYLALFVVISQLGFATGHMFVGVLNRPQLSWRSIQLSYTLPVSACAVAFVAVTESPRWLMARGQLARAEVVMMNSSRLNGLSKRKAQFLWRRACNEIEKSHDRWTTALRMPTRGLLVSSTNIRFLLVVMVCRFSCTLVYLSAVTHFVQRSMRPVFDAKYLATLDMACVVAGGAFLERYGRIRTSAVCFFVAGVAWTLTAFVQSEDDLEYSVLVFIGLLAQAAVHCVLPVVNVELFPQLVLTFAYCWGEASSLLGALGSPYIMLLARDNYPVMLLLLFAIVTLISGGLVLTVPETRREAPFVARSAAPSLFDLHA